MSLFTTVIIKDTQATVIIKDTQDNRIEVVYCPLGSLQAKVLNVPKKAFLEACSEYADKVAASVEG